MFKFSNLSYLSSSNRGSWLQIILWDCTISYLKSPYAGTIHLQCGMVEIGSDLSHLPL